MVIYIIFSLVVIVFGFVLLYGAPYVPTLKKESETALDLLDLKPGQILYELGSGDGRVLKRAAERGLYAVGYELNPLLVIFSMLVTFKYRKQVKIIWGNYWKADLKKADGVFVFLLDRFMKKLDAKMQKETNKSVRLVSYAFSIPGKKIIKQQGGLFLYEYK